LSWNLDVFLNLLLLIPLLLLAELWLLVWLSQATSVLGTVAVVVGTGMLGGALARRQKASAARVMQAQSDRGEMPTAALTDRMLMTVAGGLFLFPGLLTHFLGFVLLIPAARGSIRRQLAAWFKSRVAFQFQAAQFQTAGTAAGAPAARGDSIIDVEFTRHPADPERLEGHTPR
jgi:UPF0716 protein FxsA